MALLAKRRINDILHLEEQLATRTPLDNHSSIGRKVAHVMRRGAATALMISGKLKQDECSSAGHTIFPTPIGLASEQTEVKALLL
ncbi:hypothetical protein [Cyanobium sp. ATX 6F1]|uniref:hypothetical protein n=1 Tax=unclassified Cyanobium TaxID=2627006 RepID=UPI0020CEDD41|nr:hypothetical protein [Cyanobium sp. ATX 6F1]MCP9916734.1 hypothetical protein [Cyanobium sp. ATX 6F1]